MTISVNFIHWFIALFPILIILFFMISLQWSGGRAGSLSWLVASGIVLFIFGASMKLIAVASLKGLWNTIFIIYIIWGSMAIYNIVDKVGGFKSIASTFTQLTGGNRILQLLVLGWAFPSFLQGVCGFGTPVAVAAPLLIGLKFNPIIATITALLGHSWAVTFGSLGSSYAAIVETTGLDPDGIALTASIFLAIVCVFIGLTICFVYNGLKGLKEGALAAILLSLTMGITLIISATFFTPYLASTMAGLVGMLIGGFVLPKIKWFKVKHFEDKKDEKNINFHIAFAPYYILIIIVFVVYLSPLKKLLSVYKIGLPFPETETAVGFVNQAISSYNSIAFLTTPGTLIFLSALLSIFYFYLTGLWKTPYNREVIGSVIRQAFPATLTVMTMSMMASIMLDAGLTNILARETAKFTQHFYPVFSPLIGMLGAFMTGSNTSSNILFGVFQRDVANFLGINAIIIASLQTTGGSLGNAICPMNVALGTAVSKISGQEGTVIKKTILYVILMGIIVGFLGYVYILN